MPTKHELRSLVRANLDSIVARINQALRGERLPELEPVLQRVASGGKLPHWYANLRDRHTLPNLDGKTVGSVVEMLLVAVLETQTFKSVAGAPRLRVNPACGVDLPDLDLGLKSPSTNYCTSEPFFSAYERLLGSNHDVIVLLTDYQTAKTKAKGGLRLQLLEGRYLEGSKAADANLCAIARAIRAKLLGVNEDWIKRLFQFLAYVNQSDWLANQLLQMVVVLPDRAAVQKVAAHAEKDHARKNRKAEKDGKAPVPEASLEAIQRIRAATDPVLCVIDEAQSWICRTWREMARFPNDNEWDRLKTGPLDGCIGVSFALQWRYNFKQVFEPPEKKTASKKKRATKAKPRRAKKPSR